MRDDMAPGTRVEAVEDCYAGDRTLEVGTQGVIQTSPPRLPDGLVVVRWDARPDVPCTAYERKVRPLTEEATDA